MRSALLRVIGVLAIASTIAAPLHAFELHRSCARQTACEHHLTMTSSCCSVTPADIMVPAIMSDASSLRISGGVSAAIVYRPYAAVTVPNVMTARLGASPPLRIPVDLLTLFGTLLI